MVLERLRVDDSGMKQTSFASAEYAGKKKATRRERFLGEMNAVVQWSRLEALIEPHCPKAPRSAGRLPACPACYACTSHSGGTHGDSGYTGLDKRDEITGAQAEGKLRDIDWRIAMKRGQIQAMPEGARNALYEWF